MKEKKGISLIVLIVTIIVMIIIAGAVIISLTETNIIDQAELAVEKHNESELQAAASMAYSNWLLEEKTGKNPGHVQNYIRNELIRQNVATWEDFSKWYITPTGGIEEIDQEAFTLMLNIPEDNYMFSMRIGTDGGYNIDWGDNVVEKEQVVQEIYHIYDKKGIYEVKITGNCDMFSNNVGDAKEIFAIKSWGNVGLIYNYMYGLLLEYIAVPNENSFTSLDTFMLMDVPIQEIPDYLFKNCDNLKQIDFSLCPNLTSIPTNIFDGISQEKVSNIEKIFPEGVEVPSNW